MQELKERLSKVADRIPQSLDILATEEATKNALIMPFIQALGYDVFDPQEVVPELVADIGTKKGEKVDYAIRVNGELAMLFEAKAAAARNLGNAHSSQLFRYFTATDARVGILTNGVEYEFYSDIDKPNKMDENPFLVINMRDLRDEQVQQLSRLCKENFNLESVVAAASDLKEMRILRGILETQLEEPSDAFLKFLFQETHPGRRFSQSAQEAFSHVVKSVINQVVKERVNARLRSALQDDDSAPASSPPPVQAAEQGEEVAEETDKDRGIETTEEELQAFNIVRAIVCAVLPIERVSFRDAKSYASVLVDDNNRKPLCRIRFNRSQNYLGLFDVEKNETKHALSSVEGIYQFADQLREAAERYKEAGS